MNYKIDPYERFEFAFIFIPKQDQIELLFELANLIHSEIKKLKPIPISDDRSLYQNQLVKFPHISVGQYGIMGCEIRDLYEIVKKVAHNTSILHIYMCEFLSVLDNYIFFDALNCYENVDNIFKDTFLHLRESLFNEIHTKFPIKQAYLTKKKNINNPIELKLIDQFYQNWMIPENNRMRPHFTMQYFPPYDKIEIEESLQHNEKIQKYLKKLNKISLDKIGVIEIDIFGNPLKNSPLFNFDLIED